MRIALGRNAEEEVRENVHKVVEHLNGSCGLFFTNEEPNEIKKLVSKSKQSMHSL
jgi:ribosomal protein L10